MGGTPTKGKTPNWTRLNEYNAWKDYVRESVSGPLPAPTQAAPVRVDVWCYFQNGTHNDPENVRKGIVDALFPAGDKYVYGYHHFPQYDAKNPRVELSISQGAM
ncbi:RusA family crossover junction endodeoxyribonuclease [Deinococcus oregonensis]|uniref:RusA family crossover junction endodeoxyribonuclease n=1 Tax=Deinococcus oregonensis TaxID=1805970 RepID=A0ABV6B9R7_9DEIO